MRITLFVLLSCLAASAWGQNPIQAYQKWSKDNPIVRPYLFFSQPHYAPGDTVRFKAYMFENGYQQKGSFLLNVTVTNNGGRTVARTSFRIKDGTSNNQLVLPDTLKSGVYRFLAHNDWMNGNPSSPPVWRDLVVTSRQKVELAQSTEASPKFFPEGGSLISSIVNRVVVKMDGTYDSCRLYANNGTAITSFNIRDGAGSFHFTPQPGNTYSIAVGPKRFMLPSAVDDGVGISLTRDGDRSSVSVLLRAPQKSVYRQGKLYVLLTANGVAHYSQAVSFGDMEVMQFGIPVNTLPAGIGRLTVVSDNYRIIAERSFLIDYESPPQLILKARQNTVKPREQIEVDIQLVNHEGAPLDGEVAVSALNQRLFPGETGPNFRDDILVPADASVRIDRRKAGWEEHTDLLLIAAGVDSAQWHEVFSTTPIERSTGRYSRFVFAMKDKATGNPLPDHTRILIYLQANANGYVGVVSGGLIELVLPGDFWGVDDFYFVAETENGYNGDIEATLQDENVHLGPAPRAELKNEIDLYADFISKVKLINRSYGFFTRGSATLQKKTDPNFSIEDELNGADVDVDLRKFISFPNMDEVLREVIPALSHRRAGNKSLVRVDLINTERIPKDDPLYVIDGLMTLNTNYFMSLTPADILTIKVVRDIDKLNRLGGIGRNGVVIVQTLKPDPKAVKATGAYATVQGISSPIPFSPPLPARDQSRVPDFRSTLYWNPSIRTNKEGKAVVRFQASDDIGPILINVLGTTAQGIPFSGQTIVETVIKDPNK